MIRVWCRYGPRMPAHPSPCSASLTNQALPLLKGLYFSIPQANTQSSNSDSFATIVLYRAASPLTFQECLLYSWPSARPQNTWESSTRKAFLLFRFWWLFLLECSEALSTMWGAGEMSQGLRAFAALLEDHSLAPSTSVRVAHNHL